MARDFHDRIDDADDEEYEYDLDDNMEDDDDEVNDAWEVQDPETGEWILESELDEDDEDDGGELIEA